MHDIKLWSEIEAYKGIPGDRKRTMAAYGKALLRLYKNDEVCICPCVSVHVSVYVYVSVSVSASVYVYVCEFYLLSPEFNEV